MLDKFARATLKFFRGRSLKYGSASIAVTAVVIAIAVVINLLVGLTDIKWDLTSNKLYSLGDVTKELLSGLDKDVEIIGLFDEVKFRGDADYADMLRLLEKYQEYSHIKLSFIDPDRNPGLIKDLDPDNDLTLAKSDFIIMRDNKKKKLSYNDMYDWQFNQQTFTQDRVGFRAEEAFSGAVKYVAAEYTPTVFFVEGHGELGLDAYFSSLRDILVMNNYEVKKLNLMTSPDVPEEAELLIFANPEIDLSPAEYDRLKDYLYGGGKSMFLFDYNEFGGELDNFNAIFESNNVAINNDKVKEGDENYHLPDDPYFIVSEAKANSIIQTAIPMILKDSRSVSILKNAKEYITTTSLLQTTSEAVSEPVSSGGQITGGPLDLAVAVENSGGYGASKIVLMGNASFVTDNAVNTYGQFYQYGMRVFLNALSWMLGVRGDIIIESKVNSVVTMSMSEGQLRLISIALIIILPLMIMGAGLVVYLRRRHL